ncbi:hypothetical protein [Novacetimonas hansenii]|uniref:hypothetical protein n=1 Tax=Novacetimonas hansenii TaxID=436 RepID=UPI001588163D|nr:hypothetical protein [Novacetimonas hansenii]
MRTPRAVAAGDATGDEAGAAVRKAEASACAQAVAGTDSTATPAIAAPPVATPPTVMPHRAVAPSRTAHLRGPRLPGAGRRRGTTGPGMVE